MIVLVWVALFGIFVGSYAGYYSYLRKCAGRPWGLKLDATFEPTVSVLVPAHNEEGVIRQKLENLRKVAYSPQKLEVIVVDDASSDGTLREIKRFAQDYPDFGLRVVEQNPRSGKAGALNKALLVAMNEVVVVTDADSFWKEDTLRRALPFLSDPTVGAMSGRQVSRVAAGSWVAKAEMSYLDLMSVWRLGESKVHSSIRFEGVFCAFKRGCLREFDSESGSDDSGTALRVVQNGSRAVVVPDVSVASDVPTGFGERMRVKSRRAVHLAWLWIHCLKFLLQGRLVLPKRIAVPEIFISLVDPFVFIALVALTVIVGVLNPVFLVPLIVFLGILTIAPQTRSYLVHAILDQFVMLYSILSCARRKRVTAWEK